MRQKHSIGFIRCRAFQFVYLFKFQQSDLCFLPLLFIDLSIAFTRIFGSFVIAFTMNSRGTVTGHRLSSATSFRSRISFLILSMFATMAAFYVAGRLALLFSVRVLSFNLRRDLILLPEIGSCFWDVWC